MGRGASFYVTGVDRWLLPLEHTRLIDSVLFLQMDVIADVCFVAGFAPLESACDDHVVVVQGHGISEMIFFHVPVDMDERCEAGAWAAVNRARGRITLSVLVDDMLLQSPLVLTGLVSDLGTVWQSTNWFGTCLGYWLQFVVFWNCRRALDKNGQYPVQPCRSAHVHVELIDGASIGRLRIVLVD